MLEYAKFRPTGFDPRGLGLDERQDWLVMEVTRTRDSDLLTQSNWDATLRGLGGESETVEVHRFGHWGPGWYEIILIKPDSPQVSIAEEIEGALSNYPVLDDSDYSERQWDAHSDWVEQVLSMVESKFDGTINREKLDYGMMYDHLSWETYEDSRTPEEHTIHAYLQGAGLWKDD